jgi:hypothetical protein
MLPNGTSGVHGLPGEAAEYFSPGPLQSQASLSMTSHVRHHRRATVHVRIAIAVALASACGFDRVAERTGRTEAEAAELLRRDAPLARTLCRRNAVLHYLQERLGLITPGGGEGTAPLPFHLWYERKAAFQGDSTTSSPLTWTAYCRELDQTGITYHAGVLTLREYAIAVRELARGKDFDGAGLEQIGSAAGAAAERLSAGTGLVSAIKGAGAASASLSATAVREMRILELRQLLRRGAPDVAAVVGGLRGYLRALEDERTLTAHGSDVLERAIEARGLTPPADLAMFFAMSTELQTQLAQVQRSIAVDLALLENVDQAHRALVAAAATDTRASRKSAADAADQLASAAAAVMDRPPE